MSFAPATVTGAAVTGLTSPTYTFTIDSAPSVLGKQYYVSSLGGTQTGVLAHSIASPFTATLFKPAAFRSLSALNSQNQLISVPRNVWSFIVRKGMIPLAAQAAVNALVRTRIEIPAGSDVADANTLAALFSMYGGLWNTVADGIVTSLKTGAL